MKFIEEVDIELVNEELNFHSQDNNLVIKGGCDLFTTKPIGSDRKLFKTIDKHLDQILKDNQLSRSIERERQNSASHLFGSSSSPPGGAFHRRGSYTERKDSAVESFRRSSVSSVPRDSLLTTSLNEHFLETDNLDESPFGPLKNVTTRKTFAYLIAILNSTYPDHDFSNLQPTTENFHRINDAEDFIGRFNNIMVSLGKKEEILNWIWDTVNVYMDLIPSKSSSPRLAAQNNGGSSSRKNSFSTQSSVPRSASIPNNTSPQYNLYDSCQIFQFQPSDESILEDLSYPYQTMWSYYWFVYNKKKKRVAFIYLTAINKIHYSMINSNQANPNSRELNSNNNKISSDGEDEDIYMQDYLDEELILDDEANDVIGDMEI
ncbi:repressor of RNA polymerase III transcription MAF1 [Suhomyces tanzawaensis NRRL Y-17324]|uniref:Repressor of RNA polymerase III transcription MAF1 n=1 Tax=Suhomyces tanzawaensis NRRL Y-17324 TaxID=984487 RepID=A0A1E4SNV6_9ASCO|nr:repressor of RNA polymerase III transcription MAF1 [Suhomyces tanzawaensis NRRL Y-17324]ODV81176.1 repressor of RNA polymerase III transcription MAF1 [Suhomyces tanzawaensis NRRL Y-17324]